MNELREDPSENNLLLGLAEEFVVGLTLFQLKMFLVGPTRESAKWLAFWQILIGKGLPGSLPLLLP
jgi:hypothetical protein